MAFWNPNKVERLLKALAPPGSRMQLNPSHGRAFALWFARQRHRQGLRPYPRCGLAIESEWSSLRASAGHIFLIQWIKEEF